MKYTCYICGKEVDHYHGDSEVMTHQYDQVHIQFKPELYPKKILIVDYKCCPDCIVKVLAAIENLRMPKMIHDYVQEITNNVDENISIGYLDMEFGYQPIKPAFIRLINETFKGDLE